MNQSTDLAVQQPGEPSLLNIIASLASDPSANVENLRALLDMQRQVRSEQARTAYERAMVEVQKKIPAILRDAKNSHTNSKYARLEKIDQKIRPIYVQNGFSLSFNGGQTADGQMEVICDVGHVDGHGKTFRLAGGLDASGSQGKSNKTAIQAAGSTITYLRRYLTCMIFNIVLTDEDDDGNAPGPAQGFISPAQKNELIGLLQETQSDTTRFLAFLGARTLDEIRAQDYNRAYSKLQTKKREMKAAKPVSMEQAP